jgi:N-formylglutamate amidohydrolase
MEMKAFEIISGESPIVTAAIHDGHFIRKEVAEYLNLSEHERLREEDPYTDYLAGVSDTRIVGRTSRFEVDLNRPRAKAVYQEPADAWGLHVWKKPLPMDIIERSLDQYDAFYAEVGNLLTSVIGRCGCFIVLDLHTYNHRRDLESEAPASLNPEINIGTVHFPRRWQNVKDRFMDQLSRTEVNGHHPDVRENIKFKGGEFSSWINRNYGEYGCSLAIEFKKVFMDERTGTVDIHHIKNLRGALARTIPAIQSQLEKITA